MSFIRAHIIMRTNERDDDVGANSSDRETIDHIDDGQNLSLCRDLKRPTSLPLNCTSNAKNDPEAAMSGFVGSTSIPRCGGPRQQSL
jgi:hypothetical protein